MPTNLCSYFWKLVNAVILSPLFAICTLPYEIIDYKLRRRDTYNVMLGTSIVYWALIAAIICTISPLGFFFYMPDKDSLLWVMMSLGLCVWASIIIVGIGWGISWSIIRTKEYLTKEYLQSKKSDNEKTDNIIVEMVKAKYHKYCPKIDWK